MGNYNVVFRTDAERADKGSVTWTSFADKKDFDEFFQGTTTDGMNIPLRDIYTVVAEGVSRTDAIGLTGLSPADIDHMLSARNQIQICPKN